MGRKWNYLRDLLEKILTGVPKKISSEFKSLFTPTKNGGLNFEKKVSIYSYATEKLDRYVSKSNRSSIGDLLQRVDEIVKMADEMSS